MSNHLSNSISPYLLQHAENPVDWYPWSDEALQKARLEDKPIFLSIGYAACHWCHVMAHESFEDEEIAGLLNRHFVSIKVDREERPDLDSIYMSAVIAMTGQGGWPMSLFLTPDGRPFFGGTYFPPVPAHGLPAFRQILDGVAAAWSDDRSQLEAAGRRLADSLSASRFASPGRAGLDRTALDQAAEQLFASYDWTHGGWGGAPKFPQPQAVEFLLRRYAGRGDKLARDQALHALHHMSQGGIYDHLAGGFARYSVDAGWQVPHFEKMLYDNALLIPAYVHGWQVSGSEALLAVAHETVEFALRELRLPGGGFASSLDADLEGEEGRFYVWTPSELEAALDDPLTLRVFRRAFGVDAAPNFEGKFVLNCRTSDEVLSAELNLEVGDIQARLAQGRAQVLESREARQRPSRDDKVLAGWNGLMLMALAGFARATGDRAAAKAAEELADFLDHNLRLDGSLRRAWRMGKLSETGFLEDHAALGLGWLAQYENDFNLRWYRLARSEAEIVLNEFKDPAGGFFDAPEAAASQLLFRPKTLEDNPTPSGNSMAMQLLIKLGSLTGEQGFTQAAEEALKTLRDNLSEYPTAFAGGLAALDDALGPRLQLAYVADGHAGPLDALRRTADRRYLPNLVTAGSLEVPATSPSSSGRDCR